MEPTATIVALWIAFAVTHMLLSSQGLRPRLVGVLGEAVFQGLYSVVALALFVPLCWVYFANRHVGALLWTPFTGTALLWVAYVLMGAAFVLMVAGIMKPSPASFIGSLEGAGAHGVHRLTRHPLFMGVGIMGALHLLWNGFASDVAFFAGFPLFAVLGCAHQDRRKLARQGETYRAWHAQTAFLPFTGRGTLQGLRELPPAAIALGVAITVGLRWLHPVLWR